MTPRMTVPFQNAQRTFSTLVVHGAGLTFRRLFIDSDMRVRPGQVRPQRRLGTTYGNSNGEIRVAALSRTNRSKRRGMQGKRRRLMRRWILSVERARRRIIFESVNESFEGRNIRDLQGRVFDIAQEICRKAELLVRKCRASPAAAGTYLRSTMGPCQGQQGSIDCG